VARLPVKLLIIQPRRFDLAAALFTLIRPGVDANSSD
jgi:hypothetical protein